MGKDSLISWTDHTHNPWWGCYKVGRGCQSCYADSLSSRWGFDVWGREKERRLFGDKHWNQPRKWDRQAAKEGKRAKVFCGSMCDVMEIHAVPEWQEKLTQERQKLCQLIRETPNLDWLLLTKRPQNLPYALGDDFLLDLPRNVWFGVSASDQVELESQWAILHGTAQFYAPQVMFLSLEPLLDPINLRAITDNKMVRKPDWVIIGCESRGAGLGDLGIFLNEQSWRNGVHDIVDDCKRLEIPAFVKQIPLDGKLSKHPDEWPEGVAVQEWPNA